MESLTSGSWQELVFAAVVVGLGIGLKVLQGKYAKVWKALQVVALIIEAADKPGTSVEDNAKAIKTAIDELTKGKPEATAVHAAARQAEVAVYEMKKVP